MTTYSAVRTTGIYCRPGCSAKPRAENVTTFELAAAAEAAGYRACMRCRPYRVAGPVGADAPELVCRAVQLILHGALDEGGEIALGRRLGVSARHLRRLFHEHLGLTPDQLARSRRAHFARRLLDDTDLSVTEIAHASGFGSLRQFNRSMADVFRAAPRELRARRRRGDLLTADGGLLLRLPHTSAYDWSQIVEALAESAIPGVESVAGATYRRTVVLDGAPGMLEIGYGGEDHLLLRAHLPYWEGLIHVVDRAAGLTAVDVGIDREGRRVPGVWGPFEMTVQTVVRRCVPRSEASSALSELVVRHGTRVPGLPYGLTHAFPSAETLHAAGVRSLGLPHGVDQVVHALAAAVVAGQVRLDGSCDFRTLGLALRGVPGVDSATARIVTTRLGHRVDPAAPPIASTPGAR